jgi:hypothetical protein
MGDEGFYITLPSTASMRVFPQNNPSNWITLMTPPIELDNTPWEVSLTEIHMPNKWQNITEENNTFQVTFGNMERMEVKELVSSRPVVPKVLNQTLAILQPPPPLGPGVLAPPSIPINAQMVSLAKISDSTTSTKQPTSITLKTNSYPVGRATSTAIPYDEALHIGIEVEPDKYYTRDDYMKTLMDHFKQLEKEERKGITVGTSVNVISRSVIRDGQPKYMYEINFNDKWCFLYDCFTIENLHVPLSRFWGTVPEAIISVMPMQTRVPKFDNLNGELPEYKSKLVNHKYYLFNADTFDWQKGLVFLERTMLSMKMKTTDCFLQPGCYSSPEHLIAAMMDALPKECKDYLRISLTETNSIRISTYNHKYFNVMFSSDNSSLGPMLGLHESDLDLELPRQPQAVEQTGMYLGSYPVDINRGVFGFYVYCDLVMPEYVGDTKANLLRVIPANSDNLIVHDYSRGAHYKTLSVKQIAKIQIVIKTDSNEELKFTNSKTLCKLHFRKKRM